MGGSSQPLKLDSRKPTMPVESFTMKEGRYAMLAQADPARAKHLLKSAQADADARWQLYEQIAGVHRNVTDDSKPGDGDGSAAPPAPAPSPKEVEQ
jgi:pyruvate-ferredoxin/flavodoxin oxidoreductase